jgi:hypothetical protein
MMRGCRGSRTGYSILSRSRSDTFIAEQRAMKPLKLNWREERLKQENARLRILLRAVKMSLPLHFRERIEEELKDDEE